MDPESHNGLSEPGADEFGGWQMLISPQRYPRGRSREPQVPACMPRRFGIGTLLVISTFCGCLIALLQQFNAPWQVVVWFCLLFLVIGLFQMFSRPVNARWASILAGLLFTVVFALIFSRVAIWWLIVVLGSIIGYLGGAIVGGVFLIMDAVERFLDRRRSQAAVAQASPFGPSPGNSQENA